MLVDVCLWWCKACHLLAHETLDEVVEAMTDCVNWHWNAGVNLRQHCPTGWAVVNNGVTHPKDFTAVWLCMYTMYSNTKNHHSLGFAPEQSRIVNEYISNSLIISNI